MSLYLGENLISGQATLVGESRNIGQIIPSTIPLTDAGLHLLDGALIQGNGIYSAFVDYIAGLYEADPTANYFCTEAQWQTSVTTYGVCGKFVYDSVNNTVRLPKVTGIIEGTIDVSALGDLIEAGLPNINAEVHATRVDFGANATTTGAFSLSRKGGGEFGNDGWSPTLDTLSFNASNSNSIYGNSSTVQPQTIKAFYYIVIATSTKTDIQVDIDEIATDLNGKVNISDLLEVQCVVETYQNGTSWYRVYSDGWCEQGGHINAGGGANATVTLLKPYKDTNYYANGCAITNNTGLGSDGNVGVKTTTTCSFVNNGYTYPMLWECKGYIAVGE